MTVDPNRLNAVRTFQGSFEERFSPCYRLSICQVSQLVGYQDVSRQPRLTAQHLSASQRWGCFSVQMNTSLVRREVDDKVIS